MHLKALLTLRSRSLVFVDAVSLETTNTPKGTASAADPVLSMYVGQLKQSRLNVASMNTNQKTAGCTCGYNTLWG